MALIVATEVNDSVTLTSVAEPLAVLDSGRTRCK